jgi:hypothetical protein
MKGQIIASSGTITGIEKMINQFYYSSSYKVNDDMTIQNSKGLFFGIVIKKQKNRYKAFINN